MSLDVPALVGGIAATQQAISGFSSNATAEALLLRFGPAIGALPDRRLTRADLLIPPFRLQRVGQLDLYYVPSGHVNQDAAVAIVGIAPSFREMEAAYHIARAGLIAGLPPDRVLEMVHERASFGGPMRASLVRMLDDAGVASALGIASCAALFSDRAGLLHSTALLPNAAFVDGRNYIGHDPPLARIAPLCAQAEQSLAEELGRLPRALVVPLGIGVAGVLQRLIDRGALDPRRCLRGFPHPSGANARRSEQFRRNLAELRLATARWFASGDLSPALLYSLRGMRPPAHPGGIA